MSEDVKEFGRLSEAAPRAASAPEHIRAAADTEALRDTMIHWKLRILALVFLIVVNSQKFHHTVSRYLSLECVHARPFFTMAFLSGPH